MLPRRVRHLHKLLHLANRHQQVPRKALPSLELLKVGVQEVGLCIDFSASDTDKAGKQLG